MAIYTQKTVWASTNNRKTVKFNFKKDCLNISLHTRTGDSKLQLSICLLDSMLINEKVRNATKHIIEHFGLSFSEWDKIACNIRKMIREYR